MRVLVACEFSGIVRDAFAAKGHDAWSCDLLPSERGGKHLICNGNEHLLEIVKGHWDLLVYHWPCTFLCNSGVRWLFGGKGAARDMARWKKMSDSAHMFKALLNSPVPKIAGENPIPHRYAMQIIQTNYSQIVQPWQFGEGETKATCLWLKGLPKLTPTNIVSGRVPRVYFASPGPDRWKERSRTYSGIATAMADQWGK